MNDEVLEGFVSARGFAHIQIGAGDVRAVAAVFVEHRGSFIDQLADLDVVVLDLAGGDAAAGAGGAGLRNVPRPAQHLDAIGVLGVLRLTIDPFNTQKHINGHDNSPSTGARECYSATTVSLPRAFCPLMFPLPITRRALGGQALAAEVFQFADGRGRKSPGRV